MSLPPEGWAPPPEPPSFSSPEGSSSSEDTAGKRLGAFKVSGSGLHLSFDLRALGVGGTRPASESDFHSLLGGDFRQREYVNQTWKRRKSPVVTVPSIDVHLNAQHQ